MEELLSVFAADFCVIGGIEFLLDWRDHAQRTRF